MFPLSRGGMNKRELRHLLCSMLLGDGYIVKENKNCAPIFGFRHSTKQEDYAVWKAEQIDKIFKYKNLPRRCNINKHTTKDSNGNTHPVIRINLAWAKYMRHLRPKVYTEHRGYKNVE